MKKAILIALASVAVIGVQAELITDEGASTPSIGSNNIVTGDSTPGNLGTRPVDWSLTTKHSARGQSFTFAGSGDYSLDAIWVRVGFTRDFSTWTENSLHMNILSSPGVASATPLGTFDYDATGLGTVDASDWLRLAVSGVTLTAGTEYSFLITAGEYNSAHAVSLTRQKTAGVYTGGSELNGGNLYDIANRDTDPWDDNTPVGGAVGTSSTNLFFYAEAAAVPEPSTLGLFAMVGASILFVRRRFKR